MADVGANSFENLTQSGLIRINAKEDKNVSFSLDVYMGNTSLVVFTGAGGKPWKVSLPGRAAALICVMLKKMQADPTTQRQPVTLNEWVEEDGKRKIKPKGTLGFGIDEQNNFYIDIAATELNGRFTFLIRGDSKFDFTNTNITDRDTLVANIQWVINQFSIVTTVAERISSFKRQSGGGGGYNKGGGGGNRSYGGGNGGGNYGGGNQNQGQRPQQSNTFGGDSDEFVI